MKMKDRRTEHVFTRLSKPEMEYVKQELRRLGYKSLSSFVRAKILKGINKEA